MALDKNDIMLWFRGLHRGLATAEPQLNKELVASFVYAGQSQVIHKAVRPFLWAIVSNRQRDLSLFLVTVSKGISSVRPPPAVEAGVPVGWKKTQRLLVIFTDSKRP